MTARQVSLAHSSFSVLATMAADVTALFYRRLFELDPALKRLFQNDMEQLGAKFMTMLVVVMDGLDTPNQLLADAQNLGRRHVDYGVVEADYERVKEALLWTFQRKLGDEWTADVEAAWLAAYTMIADAMIAAARDVPPVDLPVTA